MTENGIGQKALDYLIPLLISIATFVCGGILLTPPAFYEANLVRKKVWREQEDLDRPQGLYQITLYKPNDSIHLNGILTVFPQPEKENLVLRREIIEIGTKDESNTTFSLASGKKSEQFLFYSRDTNIENTHLVIKAREVEASICDNTNCRNYQINVQKYYLLLIGILVAMVVFVIMAKPYRAGMLLVALFLFNTAESQELYQIRQIHFTILSGVEPLTFSQSSRIHFVKNGQDCGKRVHDSFNAETYHCTFRFKSDSLPQTLKIDNWSESFDLRFDRQLRTDTFINLIIPPEEFTYYQRIDEFTKEDFSDTTLKSRVSYLYKIFVLYNFINSFIIAPSENEHMRLKKGLEEKLFALYKQLEQFLLKNSSIAFKNFSLESDISENFKIKAFILVKGEEICFTHVLLGLYAIAYRDMAHEQQKVYDRETDKTIKVIQNSKRRHELIYGHFKYLFSDILNLTKW